MRLWTYRRPFTVHGEAFVVLVETGFTSLCSRLMRGQQELARDQTTISPGAAEYRNHLLRHTLRDGSTLEVESGYVSWWSAGISVRVNGQAVHESHPGRTIAWPMLSNQGPMTAERAQLRQAQEQRDRAQWQRNKPSLCVDIALALLFFAVSKLTGDLTTAALVGAGAGLAVVVAQRFVKVDLLGGLALFGVCTLLLSAGFSLLFQDERMVQLKGTILGLLVASFILGDALLNRGRYIGVRMARYAVGWSLDPRRLAFGVAGVGLTMALLNLLATHWLSKDAWLTYTTFVDAPLGMGLVLLAMRWANRRPEEDPTA
jgi:intracellular septation protein A